MLALREQIFSISHKKREPIVVPEWVTPDSPNGITVYAVTMTNKNQSAYFRATDKHPLVSANALYVIFGLEDEDGKPVFTIEDLDAVCELPAAIVTRLAKAITSLQPSIDDAKKNS